MEKHTFLLLLLLNYLCCCGFSQELDESTSSDYLLKYSGDDNLLLGPDGSPKEVQGKTEAKEPDIEASIYEIVRELEEALEEGEAKANDADDPEDSYPEAAKENPPVESETSEDSFPSYVPEYNPPEIALENNSVELASEFSTPKSAPENDLPRVLPEYSPSGNPPEDNPSSNAPEGSPSGVEPEYTPPGFVPEYNPQDVAPEDSPSAVSPGNSPPGVAPEHSPPDIEPEYNPPGVAGEDNPPVVSPDSSSPEIATDIIPTESDDGSEGSPQEPLPCNYGDLNSLADLLIRHVRTLVPNTVYLPDQKKGPFYFRVFHLEGASQFARRSYPAVACSYNSLTLVVPLHWERPLIGYFELGFSRFKTPIILTLERLEAEAVLELKFKDNIPYTIHVNSIRFTRSYDVKVRTMSFGFLRSVPEKMGAWLAKFFETRIRNFLTRKFRDILNKQMMKALIGGELYER